MENKIYKFWEDNKIFKYKKIYKKNFCILLPPPNITGNLHIGHALQHIIMDFFIRFNRMNNKNTLWLPGLDHAGIATQILIERIFKNINKNKYIFYKNKTLKWKKKLSKCIIQQMKLIGNSIYWPYIRYTLDKKYIHTVKYAFINLYENKIIYKDKKIVNWDIKLKTSISDLEVIYKKKYRKIWYIKFFLYKNNNKYIIISTTKLEKILGCVAILYNKDISNFLLKKNSYVIVPILNRKIPIIESNYKKDKIFSLLAPAHSIKDYKFSKNNNLPIINILTKDGKIRKNIEIIHSNNNFKDNFYKIPKFLINLNIIDAKIKIENILVKNNMIYKTKYLYISIPLNSRNNNEIIYLITNQWFIKTKNLSKLAIKVIENNYIKIYPKKYKNIYLKWMLKIEDWCISRQIWWGHRIPVWYDKNKNIYVGYNIKHILDKYKLKDNIKLYREKDVLDTWFSSSLWPLAALDWPKTNKKIKNFYPTDIIISGNDIIFFWISKMIMISLYFMKNKNIKKNIPFKVIYITGLINDKNGKKMSKSNNNVINPINIIKNNYNKNDKFSTDSLRLTFMSLPTHYKNINFNIEKIKKYRNFCNKLWNSSIYIINNCNDINNIKSYFIIKNNKNINIFYNKWILSKYNKTLENILLDIKNYKLDNIVDNIYIFFWNDFCNLYIEITKYFIFKNDNKNLRVEIEYILIKILKNIILILHPISPFITEKIWQLLIKKYNFLNINNIKTISLCNFPKVDINMINNNIEIKFEYLKKIITNIRKKKFIYKKNKYSNIYNKNKKIINFLLYK